MSAFAQALGGLAQDYGQAGQIKQQSDLAQNEMQLRNAHEQLFQALAKKQMAQADFITQQEKLKASMPLFIGQPYKMGGKRYQDTWDIHQGKPGKLELGPEESPIDAFVRDYQSRNNGAQPPSDIMNAALFSAYGITPPKPDRPTVDYDIKQDSKGRFVYMPKDPANGKPITSDIIGKLAETPAAGSATLDPIDVAYGDRLAAGQITQDQLNKVYAGKTGEPKRKAIIDYAMSKGANLNAPNSSAAQGVIMKTLPVLQQARRMMSDIENLNLKDNNTPFYLAPARTKYALGIASPEGTLGKDIAGLSLGSVVEAASALQGSSRAIQALNKAMVHTPDPWVDSPKMLYGKLKEITDRLNDIVNDARQFGTKSGLPNQQMQKSIPKVVIGQDGSISIQ